ncbi:hypothetical protein F5888DRAFT_262678 [Russula emetica]|nr:hypothetical protein F5888DRAFT_262678 [Russula emetica]
MMKVKRFAKRMDLYPGGRSEAGQVIMALFPASGREPARSYSESINNPGKYLQHVRPCPCCVVQLYYAAQRSQPLHRPRLTYRRLSNRKNKRCRSLGKTTERWPLCTHKTLTSYENDHVTRFGQRKVTPSRSQPVEAVKGHRRAPGSAASQSDLEELKAPNERPEVGDHPNHRSMSFVEGGVSTRTHTVSIPVRGPLLFPAFICRRCSHGRLSSGILAW